MKRGSSTSDQKGSTTGETVACAKSLTAASQNIPKKFRSMFDKERAGTLVMPPIAFDRTITIYSILSMKRRDDGMRKGMKKGPLAIDQTNPKKRIKTKRNGDMMHVFNCR